MAEAPPNNDVDFIELFADAWGTLRNHALVLCTGSIIIVLLQTAMSYFFLAGLLLTGPMIMGLFKMCLNAVRHREVRLGDVFIGFDYFVPALLMNLANVLIALIGVPFCGFPVLIIYAMFLPSYFFLLDGSPGVYESLSQTRAMLAESLRTWILVGVYVLLLFLIGFAFFGIGLVATIPLLILSLAQLYDRRIQGLPYSGPLPEENA